jgi:hypothetical protein
MGLRPASPQPSKRHGRDPLTFTWCKLETLATSASATTEEDNRDDSDPIESVTVTDSSSSSSSSGNANAAAFKSTSAIASSHQSDWYRFPAPTQLDAKRSTPYVDNVTRLEARLLGRDRDKDKVPAVSSTKWDFKMVGQWRVGELLGKGTSGAYTGGTGSWVEEMLINRWVPRPALFFFPWCPHRSSPTGPKHRERRLRLHETGHSPPQ